MKKHLHLLLIAIFSFLSLASCTSKEEKANKLINDYMFKHLHDFLSYEMVETKVDTAYNSPIINSAIRAIAVRVKEAFENSRKSSSKRESAMSSMKIWGDSWSSYSRTQYNEAKEKYKEALTEFVNYIGQVHHGLVSIHNLIEEMDQKEFIGWQVSHKFRCNNRGGNKILSDYVFIIDKGFKEIIDVIDENEDNSEIQAIIIMAMDRNTYQEITESLEAQMETIRKIQNHL